MTEFLGCQLPMSYLFFLIFFRLVSLACILDYENYGSS